MQNQEKALELSLEALTNRVQDLKIALLAFLAKLENEHATLTWPSVLNSFALLSGQINMLNKILKSDKTPSLKNLVLLPLKLSQDRDEELEKITEGRVPTFNHEVVPNYLRTKAEPEVEEREIMLKQKATTISPEQAQKQISSMNKLVYRILDMVGSAKDEWEGDTAAMRLSGMSNSNPADTAALLGVVTSGRGLKPIRMPVPGQHGVPGLPVGPPLTQAQRPDQHGPPMGKTPSIIKTNIKAGVGNHPYSHR